jgi:hypothetical protein
MRRNPLVDDPADHLLPAEANGKAGAMVAHIPYRIDGLNLVVFQSQLQRQWWHSLPSV